MCLKARNICLLLCAMLASDPLATAADVTAERGAWRGLRYDVTGIKRRHDDSSERTSRCHERRSKCAMLFW